jgi:hypothetical protein
LAASLVAWQPGTVNGCGHHNIMMMFAALAARLLSMAHIEES